MKVDDVRQLLMQNNYIPDDSIVMSVFLSLTLSKPLLVEGPAGVGKTEIAKVLANSLKTNLIRLQCYEGLDINHAVYEWNYQHQLLHLKMLEGSSYDKGQVEREIFSERFMIKRPLLQAISQPTSPILLIDEVDRADEEFESFLLELLSEWQITIPEIGTVEAVARPHVVLTGNRTRDLSEALRRRCLYLWIDYPSLEKEIRILRTHIPNIDVQLGVEIGQFMQELRKLKLEKTPGVAETVDWARALAELHIDHLEKSVVQDTLGVVLKDWHDIRKTTDSLSELLQKTGVKSKIG